ncbi:MAG: hypothetical protein C0402_09475, partial [Thermodesulfovibrio sp.]|nr:hypothetical protein [Thermodesulfovibrio sp.]
VITGEEVPYKEAWLINPGCVSHGKIPVFAKACTVGVAPIFTGSGTRLKILEYMAGCMPVVATAKGAEGLLVRNGTDIVLAEDAGQVATEIIHLLSNQDLAVLIGNAGREVVNRQYSWKIIMQHFIDDLSSRGLNNTWPKDSQDCSKSSNNAEVSLYDKDFYLKQKNGSIHAAREILPLVRELITCESVVDIGCGTGTWASVCRDLGIKIIAGVDGPWVDKEALMIPEEYFLVADFTKPFDLARTFDLALCLEVAEHIPPEHEGVFLKSLTKTAPVILFSADIPHGGGDGHVNEQWQDYWVKRFDEQGYVVIDCIRPAVWDNAKIAWWYRQNTFLFIRRDHLECHPELKIISAKWMGFPLRLVHPDLFEETSNARTMSLRKALAAIPFGFIRILRRVLSRVMGFTRV